MTLCNLLILFVIVLILYLLYNSDLTEGYHHGHGPRRRRRRRWLGSHWGYRYRPPPRRRTYGWYRPWHWFSGLCKNGCTNLGNDKWGCQYPGRGPNDCWTATDCYGCGY